MTDGILCPLCTNLLGCPHLEGSAGKFDENLIVLADDFCPDFSMVSGRERAGVRARLFQVSGLGYLRVLHRLPSVAIESLRTAEEVELMYEAIPDFQDPRLLWEGMPVNEREEKLTYQTDEDGNVLVELDEEGNEVKRRRLGHHLKSYAIETLGMPTEAALRLSNDQIVSHILKEEKKAGWLTRATMDKSAQEDEMTGRATVTRTAAPHPGGTKPPPRAQPPAATPPPAQTRPQPPGGRVARPPMRPGARPATAAAKAASTPAPAPAQAPAPAPVQEAPAIDTKALAAAVTKAVEKKLEALVAKALEGVAKSDEVQTVRDEMAVLHDLMVRTGGTMWQSTDSVDENGNPLTDENGYIQQEPLPELADTSLLLSEYRPGGIHYHPQDN